MVRVGVVRVQLPGRKKPSFFWKKISSFFSTDQMYPKQLLCLSFPDGFIFFLFIQIPDRGPVCGHSRDPVSLSFGHQSMNFSCDVT